jgi:hypothetical protein
MDSNEHVGAHIEAVTPPSITRRAFSKALLTRP